MQRSGTADLPLHGGRVPAWLARRMERLGTAIVETVLYHYGRRALLARSVFKRPGDFASLLFVAQLGPRTLQSLALIAEVVHGAPARFDDPARFAFAHGGKDGHPFPVPLHGYDESISFLRRALHGAALDRSEKPGGMSRLDAFARTIEQRLDPAADVEEAIARERRLF